MKHLHFSHLYKNYSKHVGTFCLFVFLTLAVVLLLSPTFNQKAGNIFFGDVPRLYNVTLAQFFFTQAAYPLLGTPAPYAHYQLSRTHFIQGNLTTALDEAHKELVAYPENLRTHYILGLTYGYMNQEEKAIEHFGKFIEWRPESWPARNDRAWLQFRIGDIDGALTTIEPVATIQNNAWVQNTYGVLLMNKKKYREAREAFLYAQQVVATMTEEDWGKAYPGNDPRIYGTGLNAMRTSIENNLKLIDSYLE